MTSTDDLEARSQEIRRMAASLEEERGRLAAILESMSDAVVVIDSAGDIILTNPAYERIRTATALYGADGDPLPPQQRPLTRAARGEPFTDQFFSESPEGARFWYEAAARPIAGDQNGMVLVIRDITERSLREFQEQFLAIASHELRTPLTVLQGYLQMLERQLGQTGDADVRPAYLVKALAQTRRISELITNFLDVSRLQAGKLTLERRPLDLAALITGSTEIVRGLASQQTIHVSGEGSIPVQADRARLEQVLLNLLTNAIRYAPETDHIDVRYRVEDGEAIVEVQDYGPGIAPHDQRRLFRRFYQAPAEGAGHGLGLGLHIASEIVKLHGGRIGVRSKLASGSTFWITIPIASEESGPAA
jgi:two-component system, OmpR family, phosphate regulon sensor histidine kinase PhoR